MPDPVRAAPPRQTPLQVSDERYAAALRRDNEGIVVQFKGTISTPNPALVLNPFVDSVHDEIVKSMAKSVRVDFKELEFCNSSGFKAFIHWVQRIQQLPEPKRYKLRFLQSAERKWQRTSLLALSCYAVQTIEVVP